MPFWDFRCHSAPQWYFFFFQNTYFRYFFCQYITLQGNINFQIVSFWSIIVTKWSLCKLFCAPQKDIWCMTQMWFFNPFEYFPVHFFFSTCLLAFPLHSCFLLFLQTRADLFLYFQIKYSSCLLKLSFGFYLVHI